MRGRWSVFVGAVLFAVGAIGMAVFVWVKRRQLVLAAAKAVPEEATAAAADTASAVADAIPEQASQVAGALPKRLPSEH